MEAERRFKTGKSLPFELVMKDDCGRENRSEKEKKYLIIQSRVVQFVDREFEEHQEVFVDVRLKYFVVRTNVFLLIFEQSNRIRMMRLSI